MSRILVGNKADMDDNKRVILYFYFLCLINQKEIWFESRQAVPTSEGQALVDECGIKFFGIVRAGNSPSLSLCDNFKMKGRRAPFFSSKSFI